MIAKPVLQYDYLVKYWGGGVGGGVLGGGGGGVGVLCWVTLCVYKKMSRQNAKY